MVPERAIRGFPTTLPTVTLMLQGNDMMMDDDAPIPPVVMNGRRPAGSLSRRLQVRFSRKRGCPPYLVWCPEAGIPSNIVNSGNFHCPCANKTDQNRFSCEKNQITKKPGSWKNPATFQIFSAKKVWLAKNFHSAPK